MTVGVYLLTTLSTSMCLPSYLYLFDINGVIYVIITIENKKGKKKYSFV